MKEVNDNKDPTSESWDTLAVHAAGHGPHLKKLLCLSFSNRAEARARLSDHTLALTDCEDKGKILLSLNRYSAALCCFNAANLGPQATENSDLVNGFLEKCKRLEFLSRTGAFDISEWEIARISRVHRRIGYQEIRNQWSRTVCHEKC
ncbi:hypothetical protein MIMGU_mgv1a023240mg [Erythranthe guttata]|uniref:Uncharacterized protein n=1 Tax=Erythranthe guttata TaxID=4155 RepID=A0A022RAI5_ERYGU|nr:hypothetical protein MIMGU_mgv1a023240mg [Erythranthe guttata]